MCLLRRLSLDECTQRLLEIPHHLGIAHLKAGFGIRVESAYYRTKKTLLPDSPSSDEEHLATSDKRFFLLGMPDDFDRNAIWKVVKEINWTVGAIVPHGWNTWSIFADDEPSIRDVKFQEAHVLIAMVVALQRHQFMQPVLSKVGNLCFFLLYAACVPRRSRAEPFSQRNG